MAVAEAVLKPPHGSRFPGMGPSASHRPNNVRTYHWIWVGDWELDVAKLP